MVSTTEKKWWKNIHRNFRRNIGCNIRHILRHNNRHNICRNTYLNFILKKRAGNRIKTVKNSMDYQEW